MGKCMRHMCGNPQRQAGDVGAPGAVSTGVCGLLLNHLSSPEGSICNRFMKHGYTLR